MILKYLTINYVYQERHEFPITHIKVYYWNSKALSTEIFCVARINASISDGGKPVVRYFVDGRFFCAIMYYIYM